MGRVRRLPGSAWLLLAPLVAIYLGWGLFPDAAAYRDVLTPRRLVALASMVKIACLLGATLFAFASRDRQKESDPARGAWTLFSTGLGAILVGQISLAPHQLADGRTPFPSVGDLYFLLAYPFLIAAFLVFLRAYREGGVPIGSVAERAGVVLAVGLVGGAVAGRVLPPVAAGGGDLLERMLTVAYPILDLVLLMPLAVLARATQRARGNPAGAVWGLVLAGFLFLALGDVSPGYLSLLGAPSPDPYVHAAFLASYGLVAAGMHRQLSLLES